MILTFKRLCIRIGHYGAIQILYYYYYYVEDPSDANASCLLELLLFMDLQQHVVSPTHQAGGTLDLVITFSDFDVDELNVEPPGVLSDHSLITCSLPLRRVAPLCFSRRIRSWKTIDRVALRQEIADSPLGCKPSLTARDAPIIGR